MYSMADPISNVYPNINQFYMAGLMTMPMIIIEVLLMRSMYIFEHGSNPMAGMDMSSMKM
jgi:hypothetical protein